MMQNGDYEYTQPPGWERVEPEAFAEAPFEVYVNHFQSSSPRCEAFLHDPRRFLMGEVMDDFEGVSGDPIEGAGPDTRIQTWVTNHHRTLSHMVLYATALATRDADSGQVTSVDLTLYKKEPGGH